MPSLTRRRLALGVSIVALAASSLPAQKGGPAAAPIALGSRARVQVFDFQRPFTAIVARVGTDSLWIVQPRSSDTLRLSVAALYRLDVSTGRRTHVMRDGGVGLLLGAVAGGIVAVMTVKEDDYFFSRDQQRVILSATGGVLGFVVGAIRGAFPRDEWQPVPRPGAR